MANMLTTREILSATTVASRQTLMRYANQGLVAAPETGVSPTGKGQALYWHPRVVVQCQKIRRLKADGLSLEEIEAKMSRGGRRKKTVFDGDPQTVAVAEAIIREIKRVARYAKDERSSRMLTLHQLVMASSLNAKGLRPVLIVVGTEVVVVSEAEAISTVTAGNSVAMVILPLQAFFDGDGVARKKQTSQQDDREDREPDSRVVDLG